MPGVPGIALTSYNAETIIETIIPTQKDDLNQVNTHQVAQVVELLNHVASACC